MTWTLVLATTGWIPGVQDLVEPAFPHFCFPLLGVCDVHLAFAASYTSLKLAQLHAASCLQCRVLCSLAAD